LLDFGGREVGLIVEEIVGLDGGFAVSVEGDGNREEGGGLFVFAGVVGVGRVRRLRREPSLGVNADGEEESECCGQEECAEK
jgi:hypothetical protein